MDPDKYQQAWQDQSSQTRVKIYEDFLLNEVQHELRNRQVTPFRTNCILIVTELLVVVSWRLLVVGPKAEALPLHQDLCVWIIGCMILCHLVALSGSRAPKPNVPESLFDCLKFSLNEMERDIDCLRNVWKGFLVLSILLLAMAFQLGGVAGRGLGVFSVLFASVYFLVELFVSYYSEPRRQKLLTLLTSLRDETNSEPVPHSTSGTTDVHPETAQPRKSKKPIEIALVVLVLVANIGSLFIFRDRFSRNLHKLHFSDFAAAAKSGLEAYQQSDFDLAIAAWDEAIRLDPSNSEVHRWRGDALLNKYDFDNALSEYDEAIRLDSENGMAYLGRGVVWTEKGGPDKAIAAFEEALRLDSDIASMPFYKRYRKAAESLDPKRNRQAAESLNPSPQGLTFEEEAKRGLDAFERRDFDQAIAAFDNLIRLDPNHSEAHRWRGDASLNKHQYDKALSEYDEAIRLDPENGMAYFGRGAIWTQKYESEKALAAFDEALRLNPAIANMPVYKRFKGVAESLRPSTPISPKK
jgi:tetratricopeptide (TPR) repeat protein